MREMSPRWKALEEEHTERRSQLRCLVWLFGWSEIAAWVEVSVEDLESYVEGDENRFGRGQLFTMDSLLKKPYLPSELEQYPLNHWFYNHLIGFLERGEMDKVARYVAKHRGRRMLPKAKVDEILQKAGWAP